jgi:predicted nucleic acid-binding protein
MTPLVVDSSIVIKWFVLEFLTAEAMKILDGYQSGQHTFLAPDHLYAEMGNIVWKKHILRGMPATDAERVMRAFRKLTFQLNLDGGFA